MRRTEKDIRTTPSDNFFLIVQEEGSAFMKQHSTTRMMKPGDLILIDSAHTSEFTFFGNFSRQLSLHLPRVEMVERFGKAAVGGQYAHRSEHHAVAISAILAKAFDKNTNETQTSFLKEAIYGMVGAMLWEKSAGGEAKKIETDVSRAQILERGMAFVDRFFVDSSVTTQTISEKLGLSTRQLQRAFALAGMTPTDYLLKKRLERACQMLTDRMKEREPMLVSTIAYACGFNDVSYFNRQFRKLFGCAPGQFGRPAE
ncbi:transcriptional regulator, AraC family [Tropicibacter naphthalenivorans]|uniref:Transcriptional activator NphR n=2 Tax=Tropicibacter naphthalenivorans TaxID=441103 RepID=A0A0P1H3B5_9RHOB|nr:Transcriptional activator NphR [Tropicibacter naphthalenivorans]SMD04702.1 transcriptional regulator, AraC family [Tropicibacter naphthalenivorans]